MPDNPQIPDHPRFRWFGPHKSDEFMTSRGWAKIDDLRAFEAEDCANAARVAWMDKACATDGGQEHLDAWASEHEWAEWGKGERTPEEPSAMPIDYCFECSRLVGAEGHGPNCKNGPNLWAEWVKKAP